MLVRDRLLLLLFVYLIWSGIMWSYQFLAPTDYTPYVIRVEGDKYLLINEWMTEHYLASLGLNIIYAFCFPIMVFFAFGYALYWKEYQLYDKLVMSILLCYGISGLSYMLFTLYPPLSFYPNASIIEKTELVHTFYIFTATTFTFPSLHTSISVMIASQYLRMRKFSKWVTSPMVFLGLTIPISTVMIGQHWIIDVIGGILLAALAIKTSDKYKITLQVTKHEG